MNFVIGMSHRRVSVARKVRYNSLFLSNEDYLMVLGTSGRLGPNDYHAKNINYFDIIHFRTVLQSSLLIISSLFY